MKNTLLISTYQPWFKTVTALERALNNIGRIDVVEKCNFAEIGHYPSQNGVYAEPEKRQSNQTIKIIIHFILCVCLT